MAIDFQPTTGVLTQQNAAVSRPVPRLHPVAAQVRKNFATSSYPELRRVESVYRAGHITLTGLVASFHLKQLATALAKRVEGVEQIDNRVEVAY